MTLPVLPVLASNPVGWTILGVAGYMAYRTGKKTGSQQNDSIEQESSTGCAVKSVMKTAYKAKMKIDNSLGKTKSNYSEMWDEARSDVDGSV